MNNSSLITHHSSQVYFCLQCGKCTSTCPVARYSDDFNPRLLLQEVLFGDRDSLIGKDSIIWLCASCFSCLERCPQDISPIDVIINLKNIASQNGILPQKINDIVDAVLKTGRTTQVTDAIIKRRMKLGLPELPKCPVEELKKLL